MSTSDYGEGASGRQPQIPAVIPGSLYTRQQLIFNLGVGKQTIANWITAGLPVVSGAGTKTDLIFADDLISFLRTNRE